MANGDVTVTGDDGVETVVNIDIWTEEDVIRCWIYENVLNCDFIGDSASIEGNSPLMLDMYVEATMASATTSSLDSLSVTRPIKINIFYCDEACLRCDENKISLEKDAPTDQTLGTYHASYDTQVLGLLLENTSGCTYCQPSLIESFTWVDDDYTRTCAKQVTSVVE